jgi:hypothetical protein
MQNRKLTIVAALLLAASAASCGAPGISVMPRYGQTKIEGRVSANALGVQAYNNFNSDLGLDTDDGTLGGRVDLDWAGLHVLVNASKSKFTGSGTTGPAIEVGGVEIGANQPIDTDLEIGLAQGAVTWDFIPGKTFDVGVGLGLAAVGWDTTVTNTTDGTGTNSATVPVPILAGRAKVEFWRAMVSADLGWMDLAYEGDKISYLDLDLLAGVRIFGKSDGFRLLLNAGYRYTDLEGNYDDDATQVDFDTKLTGLYGGLTLAF